MKTKNIILIILLLLIALSTSVYAQETDQLATKTVYLETNPSGDAYITGNSIIIDKPVNGDVMIIAGSVAVNEQVYEDATIIAGDILINKNVGDDVRALGGTVYINSTIFGDFAATGGEITIAKDANIGGDAIISAGKIIIEGTISGNLLVSGRELQINGVVLGDANTDVQILTLGPDAQILGDLKITKEVKINEEQIKGDIIKEFEEDEESHYTFPWFLLLVLLVFLIVTAQIMNWISSKYCERTIMNLTQKPISTFFLGLFLIIIMPIIVSVLLVSIIGIPLGILLLLIYFIILILSLVVGAMTTGKTIYNVIDKKYKKERGLLLGSLVFVLILIIPIIGTIYISYFLIAGSGSIVRSAISKKPQKNVPVTKEIKSINLSKKKNRKAPLAPKKKEVKKKTAKRKAPKKKDDVPDRDRRLEV